MRCDPSRRPVPGFPGVLRVAWILVLMFRAGAEPGRTPWTTSRISGSPEPPPPARVERVFPGLGFRNLSDFAYNPVSRRWFVAQLDGAMLSFPDRPDAAAADPVVQLRDRVPRLSQFLAFAFHPGFATNHWVFLHLIDGDGTNAVARLMRAELTDAQPPRMAAAPMTELLTWRAGGHDGGCLKFGPDGMLYIAIGDEASPEPPDVHRTGQDVSDLLSSILRIDVGGAAADRPYRIPADNPFVDLPGARPEVWAFGFRNPWRMGFAADGALWVGDVGWELWECVHRVTAGYNGGWALVEGPNPAVRSDVVPGPRPIGRPRASHPHSEAASITGGVVVRDPALPAWRDRFVYGDWETGKLWALAQDPDAAPVELADTPHRIVGFAEGPSGEVLYADYQEQGGLYRILPRAAGTVASAFPRRLSEAGVFEEVASQRPAAGVEPYRIAAAMWSDGAVAERWIAVPGAGAVEAVWSDDPNSRRWRFPAGSVLVRTVSARVEAGDGAARMRRIETQLLHSDGEGWAAYSYRWNAAQTDADLVDSAGATVEMTVLHPDLPGGRDSGGWRIHARAECLRCHNAWSGTALAFNFEQLRTPRGDAREGTELDRLVTLGLIRLPASFSPARLVSPADASAPVADRARAWLHVNCAHCHRWGAGGSVASHLNAELSLADMRIVDQPPVRGGFGLTAPVIVAPGSPERSVLWFRINTGGAGHMPHLGSRRVDLTGSKLMADWIESLPRTGSPAAPEPVPGSTSAALAGWRAAQKDPSRLESWIAAHRADPQPFVRDLVEPHLPPDQRREVLGAGFDPGVVLALSGDPARGRLIFHGDGGPQCGRCHRCDGQGRAFGPELTGISARLDRVALLRHILQPSLLVAPEFVLHQVETRDGRNLSGFLIPEGDRGWTLVAEDGSRVALRREEVASEVPSAVSAMPEGLLDSLTAPDAADLLAYLNASK